jgi:hypothetical protein
VCGVFGILCGSGANVIRDPDIWALADYNKQRGNRGFGALVAHEDSFEVRRMDGGFDVGRLGPLRRPKNVLCHLRAPTGVNAGLLGIHPYQLGPFVFAHNGLFINHKMLSAANNWYIPGIPVDSAVMLAGIYATFMQGNKLIADCIADVAAAFNGQQACWLYDLRTGDTYFWRVMSTLYFHSQPGYGLLFSSKAQEHLIDRMFEQGVVYRAPKQHPEDLEVVRTFDFYTPYQINAEPPPPIDKDPTA